MGKKIIIVGNGGAGKSTLSLKLGRSLGISVTHLDLITFSRTGEPVPLEQMREKLGEVLKSDKWIIEGWSYQTTMQERIDNADTIIVLDYPLWFCYWNALKRQIKSTFRPDPFSPLTTSLWRKTLVITQAIWRVHTDHLPQLKNMLSNVEGKYLYNFHSRREFREATGDLGGVIAGSEPAMTKTGLLLYAEKLYVKDERCIGWDCVTHAL